MPTLTDRISGDPKMSRSRDYVNGVPAEIAERIYNARKRRKLSRS